MTRTDHHCSLSDNFHKRNLRSESDKLRDFKLETELAGLINTQVPELLLIVVTMLT